MLLDKLIIDLFCVVDQLVLSVIISLLHMYLKFMCSYLAEFS